jgi:hypothetical protein
MMMFVVRKEALRASSGALEEQQRQRLRQKMQKVGWNEHLVSVK